MNKMIDVDNNKWEAFGIWCYTHKTTIKKELDKFLNKFKE
jgi:hypothetical protein